MRKFARIGVAVICLAIAAPICVFRLPRGRAQESAHPVWFRYISFSDPVRSEFERLLGNAPVWLESGEVVYVPQRVSTQIWAGSPHDLAQRNRRLILRFTSRPLLFGGRGPASSVSIETTPGRNRITK